MAASLPLTFPLRLALAACTFLTWSTPSRSAYACFESIISFGDSAADTGNAVYFHNPQNPPNSMFLPYGETFFHCPTGRFSDGRLIIDFIAQELRLPYAAPFRSRRNGNGSSGSFLTGANFAVAGATALEDLFFEERGIKIPLANVSFAKQLDWFKDYLTETSDCRKFLESSLVVVGEIGGNDYNIALFQGKTEAEVQSFIPEVIKAIGSGITELINIGAVTLLVPGNFPFGCSASYLTLFGSSNKRDYDAITGCLNWPNKLVERHNKLLQAELDRIQKLHPNTTIIYADYYNALINLTISANDYGFSGGAFRACCGGGGGPYNVDASVHCGTPEARCCEEPSLYVNWDGVHLTEAAYEWIASGLLQGSYTTPPFSELCVSDSSQNIGLFPDH